MRIQGDEIKVAARIRMIDEYSGHADGPELARWIAARRPIERGVFLVHGEEPAIAGLSERIAERIIPAAKVFQPLLDDIYELSTPAPTLHRRRASPPARAGGGDASRLAQRHVETHPRHQRSDRGRGRRPRPRRHHPAAAARAGGRDPGLKPTRARDAYQSFPGAAARTLYQSTDSCSNYPAKAEPNIGQFGERIGMKLGTAIAEIMKREGIEILCGYPVNHLIEHAANADIRPVMVRQERIGLHMADAISRVTSGRSIGVFCMQHGPGAENAMGGVAQCYGESVPVLVLPMGYARRLANIEPNFNSSQAMRAFAKSAEPINLAAEVGNIFRRAFTKLKNGRGGPVIVEIPADMWNEEVPEPLNYTPVLRTRYGADPVHVKEAAALLIVGQAAGDLCRPGRALRAGLAAAEAAGRAARHPGHDKPRRQIVLPRDASAVARLGRPRGAARGAEIPRPRPT